MNITFQLPNAMPDDAVVDTVASILSTLAQAEPEGCIELMDGSHAFSTPYGSAIVSHDDPPQEPPRKMYLVSTYDSADITVRKELFSDFPAALRYNLRMIDNGEGRRMDIATMRVERLPTLNEDQRALIGMLQNIRENSLAVQFPKLQDSPETTLLCNAISQYGKLIAAEHAPQKLPWRHDGKSD